MLILMIYNFERSIKHKEMSSHPIYLRNAELNHFSNEIEINKSDLYKT